MQGERSQTTMSNSSNGYRVTGKDIPEEQAIFMTAWDLLKEFYYLKQDSSDEEWERFVQENTKLYRMGTNETTKILSSGMSKAIMKYIEKRSMENK